MTTTIERSAIEYVNPTDPTVLEHTYNLAPEPKKNPVKATLPTGPFPSARLVTETFFNALNIVKHAVGTSRSTLPVLNCVRLTGYADTHQLRFQATNLEIGLETTITAQVTADFDVCLNYAELKDWKPKQFGQFLTLVLANPSWDRVVGGAVQYKVAVESDNMRDVYDIIEGDEFPVLPVFKNPTEILLTPEIVQIMLRTRYAAATDDTRPVLSGVWLKINGPIVNITAVDGHRLHTERTVIDDDNAACAINIPACALDQFAKLKVSGPVLLQIGADGGQAALVWHDGRTRFSTRLIDGMTPDSERIIPAQCDSRTLVNRKKLLELCEALKKKASTSANILRLYVEQPEGMPAQIKLVVGLKTTPSERTLPLDYAPAFRKLEKGEVEAERGKYIAISMGYFVDALNAIVTDDVAIELQSSQMPMKLTPVGSGTARLICMPMTFKG